MSGKRKTLSASLLGNAKPPVSPAADPDFGKLALPGLDDLPDLPDRPSTATGPLTDEERADRDACESAGDAAKEAMWRGFVVLGRILQTIRDRRLYRETDASFDDYVWRRFGIRRAHADRLIAAWRVGARLESKHPDVNEAQMRELVPVVKTFGDDAAVLVYEVVAEEMTEEPGQQITAKILEGAVSVLPQRWNEKTVRSRIAKFLRDGLPARPGPAPELRPIVTGLRSVTRIVREVKTPEDRHNAAAELRRLADQLEESPSSTPN